MNITEVELKFKIIDHNIVEDFVGKLKFVKAEYIKDVYLDTGDASLYKRGIFIRVRNETRLEIKFNLSDVLDRDRFSMHEICSEYSFKLPLSHQDVVALNNILKILGLKPISEPSMLELKDRNNLIDSIVLEKKRRIYTDGKFYYMIDDVKGLGSFLEMEAKVYNESEISRVKKEMLELADKLKLKRILTGYNELYWRKHNYKIYLQGRYLLEEDLDSI